MATGALSGAYCTVEINGQEVGYATDVNLTAAYTVIPVKVMGRLTAQEFVHSDFNANGTVGLISIDANDMNALGLFPDPDNTSEILNMQGFTLTLRNQNTGDPERRAIGCVIENNSWTISQGSLFTANASIQCRKIQGKTEIV